MSQTNATLQFYPQKSAFRRHFALWYFSVLITLWTIAGHLWLGFEQSYLQPIAGVAAALAMAVLLEWITASTTGRAPRFAGWSNAVNFLPPCLIPGLACGMLLYPNERVMPIVFASALSIASKVLFRAPLPNGQTQHIFNPSNFGITVTLLALPSVGLAPPYQFTENLTGAGHWILPGLILLTGIFVHARFTGRLPLVLAWLAGFAAQGLLRSSLYGTPILVPFVPMTSAAFTLFSLYMIPDPATTPIQPRRQILFGLSVAAIYGLLFVNHIVFGMFIALFATSGLRGIFLYAASLRRESPVMATENVRVMAAAR